MEMIRTFHPVGQGAFYSEEFMQDNKVVFRVVYDCGCIRRNNDESNAEHVVDAWIDRMGVDKVIHYLFISHFDYDHVSLLRVLNSRRVCVQKVVLPLISKKDALLLTCIYDALNAEDPTRISQTFVSLASAAGDGSVNARNLFEGEAKVIRVRPWRSDVQETPYDGKADVVDSGSVFHVKKTIRSAELLWRYVSFNHDDKMQRKALLDILADKDVGFGPAFDPSSLDNFSVLMQNCEKRKGFSRIKKIYDKLDGRINLNSQLVFSVPADSRAWRMDFAEMVSMKHILWHAELPSPFFCRSAVNEDPIRCIDPGCIYTGDADLKKVAAEPWCHSYFGKAGTFQIPHHGSRHSFGENVLSVNVCFCPMSCSINRYYGHPNNEVVKWLENNGKIAVRVTEQCSFSQKLCFRQVIV